MSERDLRALMALFERAMQHGWIDAADWVRDQNSLGDIEARLIRGDYANAVVGMDDAALKIAADIHDNYVTAGKQAADWLDAKIDDKLVRFDQQAPQIIARAKANQLELVQGFREERYQVAQQITHRALVEGAQGGINPRRVAQDFRDSIGLSAQQEQWVANYRRSLESGDYLRATGYELSSGHADRTLRSYDSQGKTLTPAQIDDYTERYRQNALDYRAETIARTESLRNTNQGAVDAIQQAVDRGDVESGILIKTWHAGPATRDARESHQRMDGVPAKWGEDFVLPDGVAMSQPGDPRGGAENTANCRCTISTSFDLDKLARFLVRKGYLRARMDRVLVLANAA